MKESCCGVFFDREAKKIVLFSTFRKNEGKEKGKGSC
jgi:hypothetical protein